MSNTETHAQRSIAFGRNMRRARKKMNLTTQELAKFLEVSQTYVTLIERGERCPGTKTLHKICTFFNTTMEGMFAETMADGSIIPLPEDEVTHKKEAISNMVSTFNETTLDYVINVLKSLKDFTALIVNEKPSPLT